MTESDEALLRRSTQELLNAIALADWDTYARFCDPALTCFEPEAGAHLVTGLPFHKFYFELGAPRQPRNTTLSAVDVRVIGDVGIVCYVRLVQQTGPDGQPFTSSCAETRIWQRHSGTWKHIHFHRSPPAIT